MPNFLDDAAQGYQALIQSVQRNVGNPAFSERLLNAKRHLAGPNALYRGSNDLLFMYLALYESFISGDTMIYDLYEGARIVPAILNLCEKFENTSKIHGHDEKMKSLCNNNNSSQVDSTIFEILVALKYFELGYDVSFLSCGKTKTPDLRIYKDSVERNVECKKLSRACNYSYEELDAWYKFSTVISSYIKTYNLNAHIHFSFKKDICNMNTLELAKKICKEISKRGKKSNFTINNKVVDVRLKQISKEKYNTRLDPTPLLESPSFVKYMTGIHNPNYRYKPVVFLQKNRNYVDRVLWGSILSWESESDEVISKKIQHVKKRLFEASKQLSADGNGIAHFLIEQCQGNKFFMHSAFKNIMTVAEFEDTYNSIDLIYIHMIKYIVPLNESFDVEETVSFFSKNMAKNEEMHGCWYKAGEVSNGFGSVLEDAII